MKVRLTLFGAPAVDCDGESSALPFERRNQLVAYLAYKRAWVGRAELAALLWPEQPDKLAFTNLRKTLFRLQSMPWGGSVEISGSALRVDAGTDVAAFESALRERRVADALALYRGELLAGYDDGQSDGWSGWLGFERDRLRQAWRGAALDRLVTNVDPGTGIELSALLLEADPLDEAALRAHMSWLARGGQVARARQAYRAFVQRLADDLGLAPGAELRALHDSLGGAAAPSVAVTDGAAGPPDDGFVGRTVELRRIADLFAQDGCRLLCIVGPGGVGKTRLARRALSELASGYPDGAVFVPLDDLASPGELGARLARELGVRLAGGAEPIGQAIEFLRERHALLVFDNFEQLIADAALLERLVAACPRLQLIVTSRVRLGIASERSLPLDGLPCPEAEDQDRIEAFDAARLFVQAAQRVEPGLVPAAEATAILDICRQVEGLPLALELAATWTRVLSCDAIAAELRQGFDLLHAVDAARAPRHASMKVVFDHSWRMLGAAERDALSRLSVFRGGFSPDAARAITAAPFPVLGALADKSLVRKDGARLFLHPLIQQLAGERLDEAVARASTEQAHALHFLRMLAQLRRAVDDGDRNALHVVDTEFENCRAAWRWAARHGEGEAIAQGVPALLHFCDHRGRIEEGLTLLHDAIESMQPTAGAKLIALLQSAASHLVYRMDRYADAAAGARRALAAAGRKPERETKLQCLKTLAACCLRLGRHAEAKRFYEQILETASADDDPRTAAAMLDNLALVEKALGHYDESLRLSLDSLVQHRRLGDAADEALCLNNLADLHLLRGENASAEAHLREGLALCDRHGLLSTRMLILANLAEVAIKSDDYAAAEAYSRRALDAAESSGNRALAGWLKLQSVRFALRRDDLPTARAELAAALKTALLVNRPSLKLAGVNAFADVLHAQRESRCARRVLGFVADHSSTNAVERADIVARQASLAADDGGAFAWPTLDLDALAHRIVVESDVGYAPLIAALRGRDEPAGIAPVP